MSRLWRRRGASPSSRRLSCHGATCFILGRLTSPRRHRIITATLASSKRRRRRPRRSDAHSLADGDARRTTVMPPSPPRCRRHHDGSHVTMAGAAHGITAVMRHHGPATSSRRRHQSLRNAYVTTAGVTRHHGPATSPRRVTLTSPPPAVLRPSLATHVISMAVPRHHGDTYVSMAPLCIVLVALASSQPLSHHRASTSRRSHGASRFVAGWRPLPCRPSPWRRLHRCGRLGREGSFSWAW